VTFHLQQFTDGALRVVLDLASGGQISPKALERRLAIGWETRERRHKG
jgi:hypothetical protein